MSGGFIALATPRSVSLSCSCLGGPSLCKAEYQNPADRYTGILLQCHQL